MRLINLVLVLIITCSIKIYLNWSLKKCTFLCQVQDSWHCELLFANFGKWRDFELRTKYTLIFKTIILEFVQNYSLL